MRSAHPSLASIHTDDQHAPILAVLLAALPIQQIPLVQRR